MARLHHFDRLKALAALMVMTIHITAPVADLETTTFDNYGWYQPILNLAVPIFFLLSGYFIGQKGQSYLPSYRRKTLLLFLQASGCYLLSNLVMWTLDNSLATAVQRLYHSFTLEALTSGVVASIPLWFLWAMYWALWLLSLTKRRFSPGGELIFAALFYLVGMRLRDLFGLEEFFRYGSIFQACWYLTVGSLLVQLPPLKERFRPLLGLLTGLLIASLPWLDQHVSGWFYAWALGAAAILLVYLASLRSGRRDWLSHFGRYRSDLLYLSHSFSLDWARKIAAWWHLPLLPSPYLRILVFGSICLAVNTLLGQGRRFLTRGE